MQMDSMVSQLNFIDGLKLHTIWHLDQEKPSNLKELYLAAKAAEQQANMVYANGKCKNKPPMPGHLNQACPPKNTHHVNQSHDPKPCYRTNAPCNSVTLCTSVMEEEGKEMGEH